MPGRLKMKSGSLALCIAAAAAPAAAFEMGVPVDCTLGKTCFIQQYVDRDPGPGARDAACGPHSYDGHKGTDFRLPDLAAMSRGVAVLAVAAGTVRGRRDGMPDGAARGAVKGRECGNGVVLDHGGGWTTQYCHMREGSVLVDDGERVEAGERLGMIGQSGDAEFPHVHVMVRKDDVVIDPFDAAPITDSCGTGGETLWAKDSGVAYTAGGILSAGIVTAIPDYDAIKVHSPHNPALRDSAPALVVWTHFYGLEEGDILAMRLTAPGGETIAEDRFRMEKNRAAQFRAAGRRKRGESWPPGRYVGRAVLMRGGEPVAAATVYSRIE